MERKIVLVTGANRGIGREVASQLAEKGFLVFVGARTEKAGRDAASQIGPGAEFLKIDVSDEKSIAAAAKEFGRSADRLDVLVNNAGILLENDESVLNTTPGMFETTLRTNVLGPLLVAQAFKPFLAKSAAPRIINVSSSGGQLSQGADGWAPVYCISKTALNGLTVQLAAALSGWAVNAVCPGWVRTDMGGANAPRSIEQGAAGIVWLATEAPQKLTAKFVQDRKIIPW